MRFNHYIKGLFGRCKAKKSCSNKRRLISLLITGFSLVVFLTASLGHSASETHKPNWVNDKAFNQCINEIAHKESWNTHLDFSAIKCHNKKIDSINGIEQFTNLEKLSLHKNNIREADVSALYKLKHLNIARNHLSAFELHQLPELQDVYIFGNRLISLKLTSLKSLVKLKASANKLTEFSYTDLPALKKLYLFDNQMENIDIYHLPQLRYMDVRQNPMSDELYEEMDRLKNTTILHDGNADDWD